MDLPFSTHPLHNIRIANFIIALVALLFCLFSPQPWWYSDPFQFEACILLVSLIFLAADLCYYAQKKKQDPEHDPPWPSREIMLGDAALAVVLLGTFMAAVSAAANSYGSAGRVFGAYTALDTGYGSIVEPEREPTLEQPEEIIVSRSSSKAKGMKKVVDKKEKRSRDVKAAGAKADRRYKEVSNELRREGPDGSFAGYLKVL
ncbi:hypothetical protein LTR56_015472 [Elasticomyces elasticus]|nr:hypothetical protein LTR56_015472 [Elasticomyces elasticus]KAK4906107.1 hypothetical protein LTR49_024691 [Elasticomyces elasticus]